MFGQGSNLLSGSFHLVHKTDSLIEANSTLRLSLGQRRLWGRESLAFQDQEMFAHYRTRNVYVVPSIVSSGNVLVACHLPKQEIASCLRYTCVFHSFCILYLFPSKIHLSLEFSWPLAPPQVLSYLHSKCIKNLIISFKSFSIPNFFMC